MNIEDSQEINRISSDDLSDYDRLYKRGVELLQSLGGENWTDFNEHDPGVTILEQLCFVICELCDRIDYPIQSILTNRKGRIDNRNGALYTLQESLQTGPVTANDYRRLLADQFDEVHNVWIDKLVLPKNISGLYELTVDLDEQCYHPNFDKAQLATDILNSLRNTTNFSERFARITFLEPIYIKVNFSLYVDKFSSAEQTLAWVMYRLEEFLKPGIQFHSYDFLSGNGIPMDEIFQGPSLENGFVLDEDFIEKPSNFRTQEMLRIIHGQRNVSNVGNLSVWRVKSNGDETLIDELLELGNGNSLMLDVMNSLAGISVYKDNKKIDWNIYNVKSTFESLQNRYRKRKGLGDYAIPNYYSKSDNNEFLDLESYQSIQISFPAVYGIGTDRLSDSATPQRAAQALQLKAFLALFEQVIADMMKQLGSVDKLFSTENQDQTYFFQPLYMIPDAPLLFRGFEGDTKPFYKGNETGTYLNSYKMFMEEENQYVSGLQKTYDDTAETASRRKKFLGHLLARFGYSIEADQFVQTISARGSQGRDGVMNLQGLLQNITEFVSNRAHSNKPNKVFRPKEWDIVRYIHLSASIEYSKETVLNEVDLAVLTVTNGKKELKLCWNAKTKMVDIDLPTVDILDILCIGMNSNSYELSDNGLVIILTVNGNKYEVYRSSSPILIKDAKIFVQRCVIDFSKLYVGYENIYIVDNLDLLPNERWNALLNGTNTVATSDEDLPLEFYSSRLSVIHFVDSVRSSGFTRKKEFFEFTVKLNIPAHLSVDFYYMEKGDSTEFEQLYLDFIYSNDLSGRLGTFLFSQSSGNE
jgi:hypothetical protein